MNKRRVEEALKGKLLGFFFFFFGRDPELCFMTDVFPHVRLGVIGRSDRGVQTVHGCYLFHTYREITQRFVCGWGGGQKIIYQGRGRRLDDSIGNMKIS